MQRFIYDWIVPKSLRRQDLRQATVRASYGRLEGWISIVVNFLLFGAKLAIGLLINSIALIADSIHSLSDVSTSIIVILGYRISEKPADSKHPFGHQRAEYVATLIIAVLLAVAGIEFIKSSYGRLANPQLSVVTLGVLLFILLTILVKAWLGGLSAYMGKRIDSMALKADALHHYTDSISSILVLIAILGARLGYPFLDGAGGIAVGIMLIWAGISIAKDAADSLLGNAPTLEFITSIREICMQVENVLNTHDMVVHSYGDQKFISVHVEVDQNTSSVIAHEIATKVEHQLARRLKAYAIVHVDPIDLESPELQQLRSLIEEFIQDSTEIREYHDLRMISKEDHQRIFFDIVPVQSNVQTCTELNDCRQLTDLIRRTFNQYEIRIHIDKMYTYN
ncbi:cation diffusion facilitator family transporter [bacterium]|nr:cation diffusion facilitator family transporter [bacterium]MBU1065557.1 cation diffusion facilitator family transporter [bacterium]MBU1633771.1 cation diffusion facilitator family transporter [bacterium]MBU1873522.1 cation diffusion facilitator family transporter [bacterium]